MKTKKILFFLLPIAFAFIACLGIMSNMTSTSIQNVNAETGSYTMPRENNFPEDDFYDDDDFPWDDEEITGEGLDVFTYGWGLGAAGLWTITLSKPYYMFIGQGFDLDGHWMGYGYGTMAEGVRTITFRVPPAGNPAFGDMQLFVYSVPGERYRKHESFEDIDYDLNWVLVTDAGQGQVPEFLYHYDDQSSLWPFDRMSPFENTNLPLNLKHMLEHFRYRYAHFGLQYSMDYYDLYNFGTWLWNIVNDFGAFPGGIVFYAQSREFLDVANEMKQFLWDWNGLDPYDSSFSLVIYSDVVDENFQLQGGYLITHDEYIRGWDVAQRFIYEGINNNRFEENNVAFFITYGEPSLFFRMGIEDVMNANMSLFSDYIIFSLLEYQNLMNPYGTVYDLMADLRNYFSYADKMHFNLIGWFDPATILPFIEETNGAYGQPADLNLFMSNVKSYIHMEWIMLRIMSGDYRWLDYTYFYEVYDYSSGSSFLAKFFIAYRNGDFSTIYSYFYNHNFYDPQTNTTYVIEGCLLAYRSRYFDVRACFGI